MKCKKIKEHLVSYLDKELEANIKDEVEKHLESCNECSAHFKEIKKSFEMVGDFGEIEPSADFDKKFFAKLDALKEEKKEFDVHGLLEKIKDFLFGYRRIPAYAVSAVVVLLLAFVFMNKFVMEPREMEVANLYELLSNYEVINDIELIENLDVIENLEILEKL